MNETRKFTEGFLSQYADTLNAYIQAFKAYVKAPAFPNTYIKPGK